MVLPIKSVGMSWLSDADLRAVLDNATQETRARYVAENFGRVCPHLHLPHFDGVFAADTLPAHRPGYRMLIVNSDPQHKDGQHWMAYFQTPEKAEFFDSMGHPIHTYPSIHAWLRETPLRPVFTNNYRLQGPNGLCGAYCYFYLSRRIHSPSREAVFFESCPPFTFLDSGDDQLMTEEDLRSYLTMNDLRVFHYLRDNLSLLTQ